MAELVWGQPLGLWLYLAVAGVGFVGWWSLADSRHSGDGEVAFFALFVSLLWGVTLPLAIIALTVIYGCHWLEDTSGWLGRRIDKVLAKRKK